MRITRYREKQSITNARRNRMEIVGAGLTRREMIKYGLIGTTGYLAYKNGLSQWASGLAWGDENPGQSPPTRSFVDPLTIMAIRQPVPVLSGPAPTIPPNTAGGEGRTRAHQAFTRFPAKFPFPPALLFETHQRAGQQSMSPDLPAQAIWGFDGTAPGPTHYARYGQQLLIRNFNDLPPAGQNGGFGLPSVTTHLHNAHTPSESDGFPCDFFERGHFYDQHYPNVLAGFSSDHPPDGDVNETLGMLWYHDHRVMFTSQNTYKGLFGFYILYNNLDTGNELTGFRLPGVPGPTFFSPVQFDVPLALADKVFDPNTGLLFFDLFNLDGILGDKFLVNGKIQPFFEVEPRRYRFRVLNTGPSRWYQIFLTDRGQNTQIPFFQISSDGNLLPRPLSVTSIALSVAERDDIIIDFRPFAGKTLYLENRLEQNDGRGPTGNLLPAGAGNLLMQFRVRAGAVADNSADPNTQRFYALPDKTATPAVVRSFNFERDNGQWAINGQLMDPTCNTVRFVVTENSVETWIFQSSSGGWMHPIHIHLEQFQILSRNGAPPPITEVGRKDVLPLHHNEVARHISRLRDWEGRYVMHCHNVIHEDHAMMLRWDIEPTGDKNPRP
jgi:FtsP/CotA-like multicopper oxidase with cupredoxin domain